MPLLEWNDIMAFGWAIVFLIWGFRFLRPDNALAKKFARAEEADPDVIAKKCSRICFSYAACMVVIGIASILDWTVLVLLVYFGMVADVLIGRFRILWKDAEEENARRDRQDHP